MMEAATTRPERAPENQAEHIRQLVAVNERQRDRIRNLYRENRKLRLVIKRLQDKVEGRLNV